MQGFIVTRSSIGEQWRECVTIAAAAVLLVLAGYSLKFFPTVIFKLFSSYSVCLAGNKTRHANSASQ